MPKQLVGQLQRPGQRPENVVLISDERPVITKAEAAAGIKAVDGAYPEGHVLRYDTLSDFLKVAGQGVSAEWVGGDYSTAVALTIPGDASIRISGTVTVTLTATADYLLKHDGELRLYGGKLILDADSNATHTGFHSTNNLPDIENVHVHNAVKGFTTGSTYSTITDDVVGDGYYRKCHAENCADIGFAIRGSSTTKVASVILEHCSTGGTTGSGDYDSAGAGWTYITRGMRSTRIIGGDYTGDSGARTTSAIRCDHAEIHGGFYYSIERGPTMGIETQNFVIDGVVCKSISSIAISADTTDGVGDTIGIGKVSNCVMNACGRAFRSTCSFISVTDNIAYECTDTTGIFAFAGEGSEVWVDGNHISSTVNSGAYVGFLATEGTVVRYGRNFTDSTSKASYNATAANGQHGVFNSNTKVITADYEASLQDEMLIADCTSNTVDIDLPDYEQRSCEGYALTIIKKDATNNLSISLDNGNGTINGSASALTIPAADQYRFIRAVCVDASTGEWIVTDG